MFCVVTALAGCAESRLAGSLVYMEPYGLEKFDCAELKKRYAQASEKVKAQERLMDRASGSAAGPVVNTVVYGPDYSRARWDQRLYGGEIERKNCDPAPPLALEPPH